MPEVVPAQYIVSSWADYEAEQKAAREKREADRIATNAAYEKARAEAEKERQALENRKEVLYIKLGEFGITREKLGFVWSNGSHENCCIHISDFEKLLGIGAEAKKQIQEAKKEIKKSVLEFD